MSETGSGCVRVRHQPGLVVCSPRGLRYRAVRYCSVCKARRRFLVTIFAWYGPEVVCCFCTTRWSDGWRRPRSRSAKVRDTDRRKLSVLWRSETTTHDEAMQALMERIKAA